MKLYYGLGNPDIKYQNTRHNLGQMIINEFVRADRCVRPVPFENYPKLKAKIFRDGDNLFAISTDYMNLSGVTAQKILNYFKIDPKDFYVIHDDLDLGVGEWKAQFDRGAAGHNGVISIIENLHTQAFNRIRIGIGKPQNNIPVEDYVLQSFLPDERAIIDKVIKEILVTIY
jgi:PTH1 family peptidyl-tRNA hydrolase